MTVLTLFSLATAAGPVLERDIQREGCEIGEARECTALGLRYRDGRGAPTDPHFALELFTKGCELGDATACVYQADAYRNGDGVKRDPNRAVEFYTQACVDKKLGRACRALGEIYILGDGVVRDAATSGTWYEQGCERNDAESCIGAALSIERGDLLDPDPIRGRALFTKACELHHARGCTLLGERYETGFGGAQKSIDLASAMYEAGCALQDAVACRNVGEMALKGKGRPKDTEAGRRYLVDACAWDDYEGCRLLALALKKEGRMEDAIKAGKRGCRLGHQASCEVVERLEWKKSLKEQ